MLYFTVCVKKSSHQCFIIISKTVRNFNAATARRVIAMVRRTFRNMDIVDFRLIYKTYIRPHLEFCIQAWSPHFVKDIEVLENVQKAATNLVAGLRKYSYPIRLQKIGITSHLHSPSYRYSVLSTEPLKLSTLA